MTGWMVTPFQNNTLPHQCPLHTNKWSRNGVALFTRWDSSISIKLILLYHSPNILYHVHTHTHTNTFPQSVSPTSPTTVAVVDKACRLTLTNLCTSVPRNAIRWMRCLTTLARDSDWPTRGWHDQTRDSEVLNYFVARPTDVIRGRDVMTTLTGLTAPWSRDSHASLKHT